MVKTFKNCIGYPHKGKGEEGKVLSVLDDREAEEHRSWDISGAHASPPCDGQTVWGIRTG